jgi:hypothetical protein
MIINIYWSHVKYRYSCQIAMKLEFSRQIFEKMSNLMKIRPVGADLFHADGRTDRQTGIHDEAKAGDTLSSRHVSSCDVTCAVGM